MTQYDYAKSPVAIDALTSEIQKSAIATALDYISTFGAVCSVFFKADLSAGDKTILDGVVSAHAGTPLVQNQIQSVNISTIPSFSAKNVGTKKLFARNTGMQETLTAGSNIVTFPITFPWVKITGMEIVGCEALDTVSMRVFDTATGTYSAVPNYMLNQFGFTINLPAGYYERTSTFDADLYQGMTIQLTYTSASAKRIGVNFIIVEMK